MAEISAVGLALIGQVLLTSALAETTMGDGSCSSTCSLRLSWCSIWVSRPCWRGTADAAFCASTRGVAGVAHSGHGRHPRGADRRHSGAPTASRRACARAHRGPGFAVAPGTYATCCLRAAGEARLEAWSKVVERSVMTGGYALFMAQGETDVLPYALVLAVRRLDGCVLRACSIERSDRIRLNPPLGAAWGASCVPC